MLSKASSQIAFSLSIQLGNLFFISRNGLSKSLYHDKVDSFCHFSIFKGLSVFEEVNWF
jgi:hypothetical protein